MIDGALSGGLGRLVLVVGPSGAGKDTLIDFARARLEPTGAVVFARRIVTRPASSFEQNDSLSPDEFDRQAASGAFFMSWRAHGLGYGLAGSLADDLKAGRTVVANVSRTVVAEARRRHSQVVVVLVTAPTDVLADRLALRSRPSDGPVDARLRRADRTGDDNWVADVRIENVGPPEEGGQKLIDAILATEASPA